MHILSLAVFELTHMPFLIQSTHLLIIDHIGVIFCKHVNPVTLFKSSGEGNAFTQGVTRRALTHHVHARLKGFDRKGCMLVKIVGQNHRVHIVLEETVIIDVGWDIQGLAFIGQSLLPNIANRNQFHTGCLGGSHKGPTAPHTDHTYANRLLFFIRHFVLAASTC